MANIPIWPGSSSFAAVSASYYNTPSTSSSPTAFGFYDGDSDFKTDAIRCANEVSSGKLATPRPEPSKVGAK